MTGSTAALVSFEETARFFPKGRTELTGLPVREEFFGIEAKPQERDFTVFITGGSQGSRTLNEAARADKRARFCLTGVRSPTA